MRLLLIFALLTPLAFAQTEDPRRSRPPRGDAPRDSEEPRDRGFERGGESQEQDFGSDFFGGGFGGFGDSSGSSSLDSCRSRNAANFACGECETPLQNDFNQLLSEITGQNLSGNRWDNQFNNVQTMRENFGDGTPITIENTLQRIKNMMKSNNAAGGNGLNYMIIGQSESLQDTSVRDGRMYPRIAIKSPNSELWVTFNTDPASAAYQTLEVMRWNGQDAKYEFMELDFSRPNPNVPAGSQHPRQVDGTGERCKACHKEPDMRPNWETYRAWSGIVPSRDDMIEVDAQHGRPMNEGGQPIGMDGRAYLNFMEQVVQAKETNPTDRLALLDVPIDERIQFQDRDPRVSTLNPRAQLDAIREQVNQEGFYRIPHFPYKYDGGAQSNFDSKTADYAGPSQFAFDQMSGQNFCRISQRLIENPNYNKFKWFLAGVAQCGANYSINEWIPESYQRQIAQYFGRNPEVLLSDLATAGQIPAGAAGRDFNGILELINADTRRNHDRADEFKQDRHQTMGEAYLRTVERRTPGEARTEADNFARRFTAPVRDGFHAIDDAGGVQGVDEANPDEISALRAALEPLGIDVGQWSMMRGPNSATDYDSLAFSDQFPLLYEQAAVERAVADVRRDPIFNGDVCDSLRLASQRDLSTIEASIAPDANGVDAGLAASCGPAGAVPDLSQIRPLIENERNQKMERSKELFLRCVRCHGATASEEMQFAGMEQMSVTDGVTTPWTEDAWQRFNDLIANGTSVSAGTPMGDEMNRRLESGSMPAGGWRVAGETDEQRVANDRIRRGELADYVRLTYALGDNGVVGTQEVCRRAQSVQGDSRSGEGEVPEGSVGQPSGASAQ